MMSNQLMRKGVLGSLLLAVAGLVGCGVNPQKVTVPVVESVDLQRFMGPWYVIGVIPTFIEKDIYNAIESYELQPDGTILTTFTFNKGAFDGPAKEMNPKGFVIPGTNNAIWGMQFIWPIKAEYVISHLDADYTETIIARSQRDYVWIMARTPTISDERYERMKAKVVEMGYDISKLVKVPQTPAAKQATPASAPTASADRAQVDKILASVEAISPAQLRERLQSSEASAALVVLDVRTADEFGAGHVTGARNIPHAEILANPQAALAGIDPASELVLYCGSGRRASMAIEAMRAVGFTRLAHMSGDYPAWAASEGR
jgi:apolipoprotein D and lipocalin family protein